MRAPPKYAQRIPGVDGPRPERADAVIGFATSRRDLDLPDDVCGAAPAPGPQAWTTYPKPDPSATVLCRDSLARDVGLGVRSVRSVSLDDTWSALLLRRAEMDQSDTPPYIDMAWPAT